MNRRDVSTALVASIGLAACQGDNAYALIGKKLPLIRGVYTDGTGFDLTTFAKPALIRFWGMWCSPCMLDMPHWLSVIAQVRAREQPLNDSSIVTIHVGLPPESGPNLTQWVDAQASQTATRVVNDASFAIMKAVGISGTPSTLYVDRDGIIREHAWQFKNARGVASFIRKITSLHNKE